MQIDELNAMFYVFITLQREVSFLIFFFILDRGEKRKIVLGCDLIWKWKDALLEKHVVNTWSSLHRNDLQVAHFVPSIRFSLKEEEEEEEERPWEHSSFMQLSLWVV